MKRSIIFFFIFCYALLPFLLMAQKEKKPGVIIMTDGEVDDRSSMVRFLLYTCDVDLKAIIQTNSVYQRKGHSKEGWLEKEIDAYEKIYPNLIKHNPGYLSPQELRSKVFTGDEDSMHLEKIINHKPHWIEQKPGSPIEYMPDAWPNTPGSDKIVEVLLNKDPGSVYLQAWGGGNTASKAFYKLKTEYPQEYDRAVSKVVMYNIWYQDDAGNYIETYHPKVTMLYSNAFNETWAYRIQTSTKDFVTSGIKNNHGALAALYPQSYISEGDSPSFLYTLNTGLRSYEDPTYGGWGGRFVKHEKLNVYKDAMDDGDVKKPLARWIEQVNNDFASKLNWCVAENFKDANHKPIIKLKMKENIMATPGQKIKLSAKGTKDPDSNSLVYKWWQYKDAGTYNELITINNSNRDKASIIIPKDAKEGTVHIVLEVTDNGVPQLVAYRRIIITIKD